MSTQPEALRLADELYTSTPYSLKAAAELRRLHAENETLHAQRDALLEKIKGVLAAERSEGGGCGGFINKPPTREHQRRVAQAWQELHAAIAAVEGEKTWPRHLPQKSLKAPEVKAGK